MSTAENPDALTRRIERLAAASVDEPGEGAAVAALVGALRTEIGGVRAGLTSLRTDTGAVREDVEGLGARLSGSLDAGREQTSELAQRVQGLAARLELVAGRVEELSDVLPPLSDEVRQGFRQVPVETGERLDALTSQLSITVGQRLDGVSEDVSRVLAAAMQSQSETAAAQASALDEARTTLESRLAVLEDTLDAVSERLEALAREGAGTTTATLSALTGTVAELDERILADGAEAEALAAERHDVLDARLDQLRGSLLDRLRSDLAERDEALRAELVASLESGRAEAREDRQAVSDLAVTVRGALEGFASVVDRSLSELGRSLTVALAESREETRSELDEVTERFGSTAQSLQADLVSRDEAAAGRVEALRGRLDETSEQTQAAQAAALAELRAEATTGWAAAAERLDALRPGLDESLLGVRTQLEQLDESMRVAQARIVADTAEALSTSVASLRDDLGTTAQTQSEQMAARVDDAHGAVLSRFTEFSDELGRTTAAAAAATAATAAARDTELQLRLDQTQAGLGELRGELAGRLDELATSLGGRVLTLEGAFESRVAELEATLTRRLVEVGEEVGESTARSGESLERLEALTALAERQRLEAQQALEALRAGVAASGDELRTQLLDTTGQRLDVGEQRLAALGERIDSFDVTVNRTSSQLTERMDVMGTAVSGGGEQTARVTEGLEALRVSSAELQLAVGGFRDEWPTRTFEVVQGAKAVAEGVVREVRIEMQAQMDRVRTELVRVVESVAGAGQDLDAGTERLSEAGHALVDYLDQRDRLLEAERDRVLHDVLDAFASGLSSRERTALAGRVGDALTRRRDARDAQRYREVAAPSPRGSAGALPEPVGRLTGDPGGSSPSGSRAPEVPPRGPGPQPPAPGSSASTEPSGSPEAATSPATASASASELTSGTRSSGERPGPERRVGNRTIAATAGQPNRRREGTVVRGPGKVSATQEGSPTRTVQARGPSASSPATAAPTTSSPAAPAPGSAEPGQQRPAPAAPDAGKPATNGREASTPDRPTSDRKGRLDAMPEVPGPGRALDAAAPPPSLPPPAPEVETSSWAPKPEDPDDQPRVEGGERGVFRRRKP